MHTVRFLAPNNEEKQSKRFQSNSNSVYFTTLAKAHGFLYSPELSTIAQGYHYTYKLADLANFNSVCYEITETDSQQHIKTKTQTKFEPKYGSNLMNKKGDQ